MTVEVKIKNGIILVDLIDMPLVEKFNWMVSTKGYAIRYDQFNGKTRMIYLHREILGLTKKSEIGDHINRNPLDNRRINLRVTNPSGNARNRTPIGESKYLGVSYQVCKYKDKTYKYLKAKIRVNNRLLHLGTFTDEKTAALAYNEAAKKYFGEFANLNQV